MYKKVSTDLNFVEREGEVLALWKEGQIFEETRRLRKDAPVFTFFDGPPTANGKPHIGHVLTRAIKDLIPRYKTMQGYNVTRKAGWDTHGLPVELEVEKAIGINGKEQIEKYGIEPFIQKCKESVWTYKGMWEEFSDKVGFWADMDDPYITYDNNYIESMWWALKEIWNKGLLYKGHKIVPYCPRCGTPLASHEVAQGYEDVEETTVYVKFKAKDEENTYFLAWTTTPWTLPSNVALCVHPTLTYVKAKQGDHYYYLAEGQLADVLGEDYEVIEKMTGRDLENRTYEPLFPFQQVDGKAWFVTLGEYVALGEGTGIVHIAPAFGEDDSKIGKIYGLPFLQMVDPKGNLAGGTYWDGIFVKTADAPIIEWLKEHGSLLRTQKYTHSYPFCWRCHTPLLYYAKDAWFIEMTKVRDNLVANNRTVNWIPKSLGEHRFGDWLENVVDWGLSRDRYWGTPLNIWECACGHQECIGSIAELKKKSDNCPDEIELHRPYVDAVTIPCPKCGKTMHRVTNVIDCWFDSGSMPFAQWHYPFENKDVFEKNFPANFISEGVDQTRGWFYSLMAISTLLFDRSPYENVIVQGLVQDEKGQKMSKSKGNAVNPMEMLEKFGADAVRWYFYTNGAPWLPSRFSEAAVQECQRKFLGTLWNTYAFYVLYAEIDGFNPYDYTLKEDELCLMDRWLASKLNSVIASVSAHLDNYQLTEAAGDLEVFVDELSNWYVRRGRTRYWGSDMTTDKIHAYLMLHQALITVAKLSAPFIPFMAEEIYQNLVVGLDSRAPKSVHLCDYPKADAARIDPALTDAMEEVLRIVTNGRACRNTANIKNRQPIAVMYVKYPGEALSEGLTEIIEDELNVKRVIYTSDVRDFTTYTFKPQLRTVGPKYGKHLNDIKNALSAIDGNDAMDQLNAGQKLCFDFGGDAVELSMEDVLIESAHKPGFMEAVDNDLVVVLDTNLTDELRHEGFAREIVSKLQTMRKEAGFEVTDHITVGYVGDSDALAITEAFAAQIAKDVLADTMAPKDDAPYEYEKTWDINGKEMSFAIRRG